MTSRRFVPVLAMTIMVALPVGCSDDEESAPSSEGGPDAALVTDGGADSSVRDEGTDVSTGTDARAEADAAPDGADSSRADSGEASTVGEAGALTPLQARGRYLVDSVIACGDCHTPQGPNGFDTTKYLAGNPNFVAVPNADGGFERLPARNLTNDATGLANRSDAEIKAMILDGRRPAATGESLNPIMPYYTLHNMRSDDADAIVAYLRTVPAVKNELPRRSALFDVAGPATPVDPQSIPLPENAYPNKESALRGRYLAAQAGLCIECHTKHVEAAVPIDVTKLFAGGEDYSAVFASSLMIHPVSKNITSDVATGLGNWTVDDVVNAVTKGKSKDGSGVCPPMPSGPMGAYGGLTVQDATDIAHYIKSLPAISNLVPDVCVFPPPPPPPSDAGVDAAGEAASDATSSDGATSDGAAADSAAD